MRNEVLVSLIETGDVEGVRTMISNKPVMANATGIRDSVLHIAITSGNSAIAEILLKHGADVERLCDFDERPLHYAARFGRPEIAKLLCERGVQLEPLNKGGFTPLWMACMGREPESIDVLRILLEYGANPNAPAPEGFLPLTYVRNICDDEMEQLLLEYGAVSEVDDKDLPPGDSSAAEASLWGAVAEPFGIPLNELGPAAIKALDPAGDWNSFLVTRNGLPIAVLQRVPTFGEGIQQIRAAIGEFAPTSDAQPIEANLPEIPLEALGPKIQQAVRGKGDWQPIIITLNKQPFAILTPNN